MKIGGLLGRTLRARPSGVDAPLGLAARAGFLRPSAGGWVVLPLGLRVLDRMTDVLLHGLGCEPAQVLSEEREGRGAAYAELLRNEIQSHRQLPMRIATKWVGDAGDIGLAGRAGPHPLLDVAGAFPDEEALGVFVRQADAGLQGLAGAAGLRVLAAAGTSGSRTWIALRAAGRSAALSCESCSTVYARETAPFARELLPPGARHERRRVHTPGASTIQTLTEMLGVGRERTLKALLLTTDLGDLIFALVRGDLDASLEKLGAVVGSKRLRPAADLEIAAAGAVPGFAGPIGLRVQRAGEREGICVVADSSAFTGHDFALGANEADFHFVHVDPRRDFSITHEADIALPPLGARCAACGAALVELRGTGVARWTRLEAPSFSDEAGVAKGAVAALLTTDLLAAFEQVVAACADDGGIAWPARLAPADVHIVDLKETETATQLAGALEAHGLRVLLDDRPLSAGAKFTDADLIGCPLRITISPRSLQAGGAELAGRKGLSPSVLPLSELPDMIQARLTAFMST